MTLSETNSSWAKTNANARTIIFDLREIGHQNIQGGEVIMVDGWATLYRDACNGYLAKGGEGSRGGDIIGHTSSGAAVYAHSHASYKRVDPSGSARHINTVVRRAYPSFSASDHKQAAMAHEMHAKKLGSGGDHTGAAKALSAAHWHKIAKDEGKGPAR